MIENKLVYNNRYFAIFLFSDDSYEHLDTELIDIDIDEKKSDRKINLKIVETFDTSFNFSDVECIIIISKRVFICLVKENTEVFSFCDEFDQNYLQNK